MRRAVLLGLLGLGLGCSRRQTAGAAILVRGSETLLPLMQRWAAHYDQHQGAQVSVAGGGSGTGIAGLLNGTADIAMASRAIHDDERTKLSARGPLLELAVAMDAITIYTHPSNPVRSVSIQALREVYAGRQRSWKFLGGADQLIAAYSRENSSGTYAFFKEKVLHKEDMAASIQCLPGTGSVIRAVSVTPWAIGYGGALLGGRVRALAIEGNRRQAVDPSLESALDGSYPLARPLHVYVRGDAPEAARTFALWMRSEEAQRLAIQTGFFPVRALA